MKASCVQEIDDSKFDAEVMRHPGLVLVDFYTPGCPPCRQVAPILEEMCIENADKLKIVKIDASVNPIKAVENNISAVPTFALFRSGSKIGQIMGYQSKRQFKKWIEESEM